MQDIRPWHYGLFGAALIAMIVSALYSCHKEELGITKDVHMVDVISGDQYLVTRPKSGSLTIPVKNPDTGTQTLIPCFVDKQGVCTVNEHYAVGFVKKPQALGDKSALDTKTLTVKISDKPVRTIVGD